ncbi:glycosyltransferase family 4 protein [Pseudopedobacter beijingensis]|uniref:Glycosyltransferase family 4 protein n=1 Tax=Pseudopedobacter beijingensis TaxID=1207056 RepID=A0ABW4I7A3_9SPHI
MLKKPNVLYLGFSAFSQFGGIEQVNKSWLYALSGLQKKGKIAVKSLLMLDQYADKRYIDNPFFTGFSGNKLKFFVYAFKSILQADHIVASHIHLAPLLYLFLGSKRIYLQVHGIEVWKELNFFQKALLKKVHLIIAVSEYTKNSIVKFHQVNPDKIKVLNNCLDPFFEAPKTFEKPQDLSLKYKLKPGQPVLFSLSRLAFSEQYKGYDKVIDALPDLKKTYPDIRYLIGGKGDSLEIERIQNKVIQLQVEGHVQLIGFIPEEVVQQHYLVSDAFVMPSLGEGFGIAFIEAAANGCQVLAGNQDGSVDAVCNGQLGILVNPNNQQEILQGLKQVLEKPIDKEKQSELALRNFSFEQYMKQIEGLLSGTDSITKG